MPAYRFGRPSRALAAASFAVLLSLAAAPADAAGEAKGTVDYKGRTTNVKYAYLVKGPDAVSKQTIRRLILSSTDLAAKIAACKTMSCTDSDLGDGLSVNLEDGPRLNYWMVMNGQKVQYSGTEPKGSLAPRPTTRNASPARCGSTRPPPAAPRSTSSSTRRS